MAVVVPVLRVCLQREELRCTWQTDYLTAAIAKRWKFHHVRGRQLRRPSELRSPKPTVVGPRRQGAHAVGCDVGSVPGQGLRMKIAEVFDGMESGVIRGVS